MFFVNNTEFLINTDYIKELNFFDVRSKDKIYKIEFNDLDLNTIIHNNFDNGDFIIADMFFKNTIDMDFLSRSYFIEAKEDNKTIENVLNIFDFLLDLKFTKKNKIIVIGGGIIQDICGFLSAIYKRGVKWIFVPTTMLAMTDSCLGGKVGLNRKGKNMLGLFESPNKVIISDYFLKTLSEDMIISGLGESLKLSIIAGKNEVNSFIDMYKSRKYLEIIKQSLLIKKVIVEYDELEKNERRVLNYGHTIGHAIECATNYEIPHGIAVLFGMYYINKFFIKNDIFDEINEFILNLIPKKYYIDFDIYHILNLINSDKKNLDSNICFIVLNDFGKSNIIFKNYNLICSDLQLFLFNNLPSKII